MHTRIWIADYKKKQAVYVISNLDCQFIIKYIKLNIEKAATKRSYLSFCERTVRMHYSR
jgi:hypothetical protein